MGPFLVERISSKYWLAQPMTLLNYILLALVFTINGFSLGVWVSHWYYLRRQLKVLPNPEEPRDPWEKPVDWWKH